MAGDPRWALRQALRTKLLAASGLTDLVGTEIYDDVPEDHGDIFVVVDTLNMTEASDKTNTVMDVTASIYAWSTEHRGYKEVEQVLAEVFDALHNSAPTVTGYVVLLCQFVASEEGRVEDGVTRFGVSRFHLLLDPE
jgi:hypothetical protein